MRHIKDLLAACLVGVTVVLLAAVTASAPVAACEPLPADKGQATNAVTIDVPGQYVVWLRAFFPDANRDTVYIQVDDTCPVKAGGVSGEGFMWVGTSDTLTPLAFELTSGQHTINLAGVDAGAGLDTVLLAANDCIPTGLEGECAPTKQFTTTPPSTNTPQSITARGALRNVAVVAVCAVIVLGVFAFLIWKYVHFMRRTILPVAHVSLPIKLAHFLHHHARIVFVCVCIIIASVVTGVVFADARPGFEAEAATLGAGAKTVDDANASGGKYVLFESPPVSATPPPATSTPGGSSGGGSSGGGGGSSGGGGSVTPPPSGGGGSSFPDATNTGPSGCGSYAQYSGTLDVTTDGTVLNCIQLSGTLTINASNVTVQNSILTGDSWWGVRVGNTNNGVANFKLLHNKLQTVLGQGPDSGGYDYGISQESSGYMEIGYNDISGYKDGVTTSNGYIHDNYIHDLSQFSGAHTQDIYVYTGSGQVKIEHNTLINDSPQEQATAAIYIAPDDGHQNDRIVTNNFMAGGAYTIYGGDNTATNIVVTNNKFSTQRYVQSGYYGWAAYWWPDNSGNVWSGNTWADGPDAGKTIDP